jgi:hypothetical protein
MGVPEGDGDVRGFVHRCRPTEIAIDAISFFPDKLK